MIPLGRTAILTLRALVGGALAASLVCGSHAATAAEVTYACHVAQPWGGFQRGTVVQIGVTNLDGAATRGFIAQLCVDAGVVPRFHLDGRIDAATTAKVRSLAAFVRAQKGFAWRVQAAIATAVVSVNSDGGMLAEALVVARLFRDIQAEVEVVRNGVDRCAASCVFLLAGAVTRDAHGPVLAETTAADRIVRPEIAAFLRDMNLPPTLLEFLDTIPPGQSHRLSDVQLAAFGLQRDDPVFAARRLAYQAQIRGISTAVYRLRASTAAKTCTPCPEGSAAECAAKEYTCREAILWGLDPVEFTRRQEIADQRCRTFELGDALWRCRTVAMLQHP